MKKSLFTLILSIFITVLIAQDKKPLTFDDILKWNRITEKEISNNGDIVVYKAEPWKGNPVLNISDKSGSNIFTIAGGFDSQITEDSKFVVFKIQPKEETVRELKLKKTKEEDMPLNKLGIFSVGTKQLDTVPNLKSVKVPGKWNGWIAYQTKNSVTDTIDKKSNNESDENGFTLTIQNLNNGETFVYPFVTDYVFAKDYMAISFVSAGDEKDFEPGVYYFDFNNKKLTTVFNGKADYKQLSINMLASKIAFIADTSDNKMDDYSLFLWTKDGQTKEIVTNQSNGMPENWEISINGDITFSNKTNRLFFGTAPIKPEKDTTKLDEEFPKLDVWKWNEPVLHSQQLHTKEQDVKKSYRAVYFIDNDKVVQIEKEYFTGFELINHGDADKAFAWTNLPYSIQFMWEGEPEHFDFYMVDLKTGKEEMIKEDCRAYPEVSPEGKYIYWYNYEDTTWNTYNISINKEYKVTTPNVVQAADEINDVPNLPETYGMAGWLQNDQALLIYDRYDIWKVDPENNYSPINVTKNGRPNKINYRILDFENYNRRLQGDDEIGFDIANPVYIKGHNEVTRADGYYRASLKKSQSPDELIVGKFQLNEPIKARDKDVFVYTKETFQEFPDLLITQNEFKKSTTISDVNPQQKNFLWGTKELHSWTSLDGRKLEGLLIKPANFDPNKKYPMIVNFYEKASQHLYNHQIPEAHRSTIDYHYYSSNGYIIFNPDVYYRDGYPGESAYNCVMPGVTQLISEGFVDEKHIAAQGHSWGGYQVAYLATRTNLFAAIESGAPVVNMFSAYGGIRLWSGRNRSFQYEHTQSRIGKSIWESPLRYVENSPLFTADKIETPMLIMHNEHDGAVPFSQGIEFFIALRRMGKVAWLLNYNEADHWPTVVRDKYDFQIRLAQFFDHYLKDKPMPVWMKEGIPATEKEFELGYDLVE